MNLSSTVVSLTFRGERKMRMLSSCRRTALCGMWWWMLVVLVVVATTRSAACFALRSHSENHPQSSSSLSFVQQQQHHATTTTIRTTASTTGKFSLAAQRLDSPSSRRRGDHRVILAASSSDEEEVKTENEEPAEMVVVQKAVPRGGASGQVGTHDPPPLPTLLQYRNFALPCLALWVAGPLLSLVDTSFIGLSKGAVGTTSAQQLAALGPATTFFDGATYLFAFLNVATTNLYSSARAQDGADSEKAESVVRTSAQVALRSGLGLMLFLLIATRPLLTLYIGDKAASTPGLLDAATDYVYIRALSMPTSLLLGVLQAALLGAKDSVTPLIAILYSTIVNVCGDYLLVSRFHFGLQGAAIATTLAQWAGTAALIPAARQKLVKNHDLGLWKKRNKATENRDTFVSARTFLSFAAPVLTLILGKIAAFGFMTHSAAAVPGQPTPLASHQIILSLLFFCSPFLEVLSQTAQTFLPPFLAPVKDHVDVNKAVDASYDPYADPVVAPWLTASKKVATSLLGVGFASAAVVASVASLVPAFFGNWITNDTTIQQAVKPLAKYLWMGAFFWAPVAVSEGVLLARLELRFLAGVYLVSTALLPPALLQIKFRQGTVGQVWLCFVIFQFCRALAFTGRIWGGFAWQQLFGKHHVPKKVSTALK